MEELPLELRSEIVSHLDVPELLTCRLVSRSWRGLVDNRLAKVTHVKLNQTAFDDSPIADILLDKLNPLSFNCPSSNVDRFFTFIANKCHKLQAFSSLINTLDSTNLLKLNSGLLYFETLCNINYQVHPFSRFTSLVASDCNFCVPCNSNSQSQDSNFCRNPFRFNREHRSAVDTSPEKCLRWFDCREVRDPVHMKLPPCPSLEILRFDFPNFLFNSDHNACLPFSYPNLKYFQFKFLVGAITPCIGSLSHSPQLRAIDLEWGYGIANYPFSSNTATQDAEQLFKFTATLEHLEFLKLKNIISLKDVISVPVNASLKFLWLESPLPLTFMNSRQNKLQTLHIISPNCDPIVFNFPALKQIRLKADWSANFSMDTLDSLHHSPNLQWFDLSFNSTCSYQGAKKLMDLISVLDKLRFIQVRGRIEDRGDEDTLQVDLSRHYHLESLSFGFSGYYANKPPKFLLAIGHLPHDKVFFNSNRFILTKRGLPYRSCIINILEGPVTLAPDLHLKYSQDKQIETIPNKFLLIEEVRIHLCYQCYKDADEIMSPYCNMIREMAKLKSVSLVTAESFNLPLDRVKLLIDEVCTRSSLEYLDVDLAMDVINSVRKTEKWTFDISPLSSLQKMNFRLRTNNTKSHKVQVTLVVGDWYTRLALEEENSFRAVLCDGRHVQVVLPTDSKVVLVDALYKLRSLSVTNWSLLDNAEDFFTSCKTAECVHLDGANAIRSILVPVLSTYTSLSKISGRLSHTFLQMFLARSTLPKLSMHSSLRPIVEKIQEKNKIAHSQICYFDC